MNIHETEFFNWLIYIVIGVATITLIVYLIRKQALRSYRKRITEFHTHIMDGNNPPQSYMLVTYESDGGKKVDFVKCKIVHVYKDKNMVNVVFKKGNKTFEKSISKDVEIKLIYPEWAIPSSDLQNG